MGENSVREKARYVLGLSSQVPECLASSSFPPTRETGNVPAGILFPDNDGSFGCEEVIRGEARWPWKLGFLSRGVKLIF